MTVLPPGKDYTDEILRALHVVAQSLASGLSQESPQDLSQRLLALTTTADGLELQLTSNGLTLANKVFLERELPAAVSLPLPLGLYFKRTGSATAADSPDRVRPQSQAQAPFGLRLRRKPIPGVASIVAIASGKGGVGKSTVATNLAVSAAKLGRRVGFLDADIYGPSGPTMLGLKGALPVTGDGRFVPLERFGVHCVSFGFFSDWQHPVMWRGPLIVKAFEQLCFDTAWPELDVLVIDLPPGTGDIQLSLVERLNVAGAVIVSTPQNVALIDAHKAFSMFATLAIPILGVVANMAQHTCSHCGHASAVFGDDHIDEFVASRGTKLLARLPLKVEISRAGDAGEPACLHVGSSEELLFKNLALEVLNACSNSSQPSAI